MFLVYFSRYLYCNILTFGWLVIIIMTLWEPSQKLTCMTFHSSWIRCSWLWDLFRPTLFFVSWFISCYCHSDLFDSCSPQILRLEYEPYSRAKCYFRRSGKSTRSWNRGLLISWKVLCLFCFYSEAVILYRKNFIYIQILRIPTFFHFFIGKNLPQPCFFAT